MAVLDWQHLTDVVQERSPAGRSPNVPMSLSGRMSDMADVLWLSSALLLLGFGCLFLGPIFLPFLFSPTDFTTVLLQ